MPSALEELESILNHNNASASASATTTTTSIITSGLEALQSLRDGGDTQMLFLRSFLELIPLLCSSNHTTSNNHNNYVSMAFHCVTCLRHVLLHRYDTFSKEFLLCTRDFLLCTGLHPNMHLSTVVGGGTTNTNSTNTSTSTISKACLNACACLWKRGWEWKDGNGNKNHENNDANQNEGTSVENSHEYALFLERQNYVMKSMMSHSIIPLNRITDSNSLFNLLGQCITQPLSSSTSSASPSSTSTSTFFQNTNTNTNTTNPNNNNSLSSYTTATYATMFLSYLLAEFGGGSGRAAYHMSLEFHRKAHHVFERGGGGYGYGYYPNTNNRNSNLSMSSSSSSSSSSGLTQTLQVAMMGLSSVNQIIHGFSSSSSSYHAHCIQLCNTIVILCMDVLSWDFHSSSSSNSGGGGWGMATNSKSVLSGKLISSTLIRLPESWRECIVRPDFLGAIFDSYTNIRISFSNDNIGCHPPHHQPHYKTNVRELGHSLLQLLLLLSSVTGSIFESMNQKCAYAKFVLEGSLQILGHAHQDIVRHTNKNSHSNITTTDFDYHEYTGGEIVDACALLARLATNFKCKLLSNLPTTTTTTTITPSSSSTLSSTSTSFTQLLNAIYALGDAILQEDLQECQNVQGNVEDMMGRSWRNEALGHLFDCASTLVEDPWLDHDNDIAAATTTTATNTNTTAQDSTWTMKKNIQQIMSTTLSSLYTSYITCRIRTWTLEERHDLMHPVDEDDEDLDELREGITENEFLEELSLISCIGRLSLQNSIACLVQLWESSCLPHLNQLWDLGGNGTHGSMTPDEAAVLEEARLLVLATTYLMTEDNEGEPPSIPFRIMDALTTNHHHHSQTSGGEDSSSSIGASCTHLIQIVISLSEVQAKLMATRPNDTRLSPLLVTTLLAFLSRWAPAYLIPSSSSLTTTTTPPTLPHEWTSPQAVQSTASFCVELCFHYAVHWPQEGNVQAQSSELLLHLARRGGSISSAIRYCPAFLRLVGLHLVCAGLGHGTSEVGIENALHRARSNYTLQGGGGGGEGDGNRVAVAKVLFGPNGEYLPTLEYAKGYIRLPYKHRSSLFAAMLLILICESSGGGNGNDAESKLMMQSCMEAIRDPFAQLVQALENRIISPSNNSSAREIACLSIALYGAVAHASSEMVTVVALLSSSSGNISSGEERRIIINEFFAPSLPHLSGLMKYFASDLSVCEMLLVLFRDYTERFVNLLDRKGSVALFHSAAELLKAYSDEHCSTSRDIVAKRELGLEEEQSYNDILCAIELLSHLGERDFIDICESDEKGVNDGGNHPNPLDIQKVDVTNIIFFGLEKILPLMTRGLLQYPKLCHQYFSLTGFMIDAYPYRAALLPPNLLSSLLDSLLFGMAHDDASVARSSLKGISGIAREQLQNNCLSGGNGGGGGLGTGLLSIRPNIIDECSSRLLLDVIFRVVIWDRLEYAGMALLPLVAINVQRFGSVVENVTNQLTSLASAPAGTHNLYNNNNNNNNSNGPMLIKKERLQQAFRKLITPEALAKVVTGGCEGRMRRLKFKKDFEVFVRDVHSFLVIQ